MTHSDRLVSLEKTSNITGVKEVKSRDKRREVWQYLFVAILIESALYRLPKEV